MAPARSGADLSASREEIEGADAPAGTKMNEHDFISALRALPLHEGARGLEDDCAVLEFGSETLIITHDAMAEGKHWISGADPFDVAWKLVATNLSDLAAKGAEPIGVLLSYALGNDDARFLEGLNLVLTQYNVPLLGGDTIASSGPQTLGLTAIGRATHMPVPARSGAKIGDALWLCGTIGDAKFGFRELSQDARTPDPYFTDKFLRPAPLLAEGQALVPHVSAMMDVSDGLLLDAARMAKASGVTIDIDFDAVPFSPAFMELAIDGNQLDVASNGYPARRAAMSWGDDYALLFTAPRDARLPVGASPIGTVLAQSTAPLLLDGQALTDMDDLGYQHG